MIQLSRTYMTTGKTIVLTRQTFVSKVNSWLFNTLSRFVTGFLPRNKCLLISWLQSLFTVILEPKKGKSVTASTFPPSICQELMGPNAAILVFECWISGQLFQSPVSLSKRLFSSSSLPDTRMASSAKQRLLRFLPASLIPICDSTTPAFRMMYSAYKLNKQGDKIATASSSGACFIRTLHYDL